MGRVRAAALKKPNMSLEEEYRIEEKGVEMVQFSTRLLEEAREMDGRRRRLCEERATLTAELGDAVLDQVGMENRASQLRADRSRVCSVLRRLRSEVRAADVEQA